MITNVIIATIAAVDNELDLDPTGQNNYEFTKGIRIDYCNSKETRWILLVRVGHYI